MKKILYTTFIFTFFLTFMPPTLAQDDTKLTREEIIERRRETLTNQRELIREQVDARQELKWDRIESNLEIRIENWSEIRENVFIKYSQAYNRVVESLNKFEEKDIDTSNLNELLEEFDQNIQEGYTRMGNALNGLEKALEASQTQDTNAFINALSQSNSEVKDAKVSYNEAKKLFQNEIVEEYKNLLNQL